MQRPTSARAITLAVVLTLVTTLVLPFQAFGASAAPPAWSVEGTRWDGPSTLPASEIARFNDVWTGRFLDSAGLQAYLDRPGLYEDGFNALPEDEKRALVVGLVSHWQATLPEFGRDLWTGEAEADQKAFEELAIMLYATIFAKDEFLASLREAATPAAQAYGPPTPEDASIPEFPGMTQEQITQHFESLHATKAVVTPPPAPIELGEPPRSEALVTEAPPMPGAQTELVPLPPVDPTPPEALVDLQGILDLVDLDGTNVVPPDPNELLNLIAGGTYTACGRTSGFSTCSPPVPLGTPVPLDVTGDLVPDVIVQLGPTIHPDYALGGFSANLLVERTTLSALPTWTPLPAEVTVVYSVPGAATQVMVGFGSLTDTLADRQSIRVTLKDIALALAGDVQLLTEIEREGPGSTMTLLAGYSKLDTGSFPGVASDPTTVALGFTPAPATLRNELRFAKVGAQRIIEGGVDTSVSPTVTAAIRIEEGNLRRTITGLIESMPSSIDFRIVSEAVGAVGLDYNANAPFPRFEVHDVLVPNVNTPSSYSTLDAVVRGVPSSIHFGITRPFNVAYTASARVTEATVAIAQRDAQGIVSAMGATAMGIPSAWTLSGSTSPIQITYTANGVLDSISASMQQRGAGSTTTRYNAVVTSIPAWLRIAASANDIVVDARMSAASQPGSGVIGNIAAQYTTDGTYIGGVGNHANLFQTATVTRASIGYSGLKYVHIGQSGDNLAVDVQNSAPRYFTAYADTPEAFVSLVIDSIPAHVAVTGVGTTFTYNAFGSTIGRITANFWDKEDLQVVATLRGVPGTVTMNVNLPSSAIAYSASSAITALDVDAWIGPWYGLLRLTGIPTAWSASFGGGTYAFDAYPQSIGSVQAIVTNHGTYWYYLINHVLLNYVASSGATDASFRMTSVQRALYSRAGNVQNADLRMGGGTNFVADFEATLANGERAHAYAYLTPLPSSIQLALGEKFTATTNQNFDVYAYAEYGMPAAITATPAPPYVHGVAIRDGQSGLAKALKGQIYLTGLPTSVSFDGRNRTFSFTNWRPTISTLVADLELDNFVSPAVDLYVSQSGIPNPQSLTFSMSSADIGSGNKQVRVDITQTAGMGALFADLNYGGQHGRLTVSNIPDDIHATYTLQNGVSSFTWDATAPITEVFAAFRVVAQSGSFQGYIDFDQLPSDFAISVGRSGGGQGPTFSYSASASTLDLSAFVDASLFGGDLRARLSFGFVNLGASTNAIVSGTGITISSVPATTSIYANVWATYNYYREDSGIWDAGGFLEYPWAYHVGVTPTVNNLAVTLSNVSTFSMQWGVTTKLSGTYGSFSFGWGSFTVNLHAYGKVQIVVDWPWPFGSSTINIVNIHYHPPTFSLDVLFHKYTNHQGYWGGLSGSPCSWSIWMEIRPHPHGASWNGVTTSSATAEGGAWYVTPNPWGVLPGWGIDLAARYTSPDGGNVGGPFFSYDCF